MCVTCVDESVDLQLSERATPERMKAIEATVRLESLERHRLTPEKFPICERCNRVYCASETEPMYNGQCLYCGLNRLEKLFFRLWKARGRKAEKKALRRLRRFARTGR
jgi:hypothetical protein